MKPPPLVNRSLPGRGEWWYCPYTAPRKIREFQGDPNLVRDFAYKTLT